MHKLLAKLSTLSVNKPSSHLAPNDSSRIHAELFEDDAPALQTSATEPLVTNIVVKHSSVFNSERASGMSNLQQLQFVQMIKSAVLDEAPIIFTDFRMFKVVTTRMHKTCFAAPVGMCDAYAHTAVLIGGGEGEWRVLEKSEEREYLLDAVEGLWEKVLSKGGETCAGLRVGDKFALQAQLAKEEKGVTRIESGTTLATQV